MKIMQLILTGLLITNSSYGFQKPWITKNSITKYAISLVALTAYNELVFKLLYGDRKTDLEETLFYNFNFLYIAISWYLIYSNSAETAVNNAINILESISTQDIELLKLPEEELNNFITNLKNDTSKINGFTEKMKTIKFKLDRAYRIASSLQNHSSQNIKDSVKEVMEFCYENRPLVKKVLKLSKAL